MPSENEILVKVVAIVSEQLGIPKEKVVPSARFVQDLGTDSLDLVEMVMAFEEEFATTISDSVAEKMHTVGDVVDYIKQNQ